MKLITHFLIFRTNGRDLFEQCMVFVRFVVVAANSGLVLLTWIEMREIESLFECHYDSPEATTKCCIDNSVDGNVGMRTTRMIYSLNQMVFGLP